MRRSVVAIAFLVAASTSGAAATASHNLYAWARIDKPVVGVSKVGLHYDAPVTRHLAPGRYRLYVAARSNRAFRLSGPGLDRQTPFTTEEAEPIYRRWTIRLKRGRYVYSAEGVYAKELHAAGIPIRGSFRVP